MKTELLQTWTQLGLAEDEAAQRQCCTDLREFVRNNWQQCSKIALGNNIRLPLPTCLEEAAASPSPDLQDPDVVDCDPVTNNDVDDVVDQGLRDLKKVMIFTEGDSVPQQKEHSSEFWRTRKNEVNSMIRRGLIFDVTGTKDPDTYPWRHHLGLHPEMHSRAQKFLMHKGCDILRKVKEFIASEPNPCVTFQCNKGKHRSVATAFVVAKCIKSDGHDVEVVHRSRGTWTDSQCQCYFGQCEECSRREDLWLPPDDALWKYWEAL